jgi:predicted RNA-binding protein
MSYWLVVGSKKNWDIAFQHRYIWGLKKTQQLLWDSIHENDKLLFYANRPVGGIIGHGIVRTKFFQDKPLWPDEIKDKEVIWPLRFEFDVEFCLPQDKWITDRVISKELFPRAGFQLLPQTEAIKLISSIHKGEYVISEIGLPSIAEEPAKFVATTNKTATQIKFHDYLQDKLVQIGKLQNFIAEKEYPFNSEKLDVVWRRVINSVPTYVFEIQIGGDIYHALGKLKHAYDLWNSHIYFVARDKDYSKASNLLSGTFHEIHDHIKYIELEKVDELYKRKKAYFDLEKVLGI